MYIYAISPSDGSCYGQKQAISTTMQSQNIILPDLVNVPSRICRKEGTIIRIPFSSTSNSRPNIYQYMMDNIQVISVKQHHIKMDM